MFTIFLFFSLMMIGIVHPDDEIEFPDFSNIEEYGYPNLNRYPPEYLDQYDDQYPLHSIPAFRDKNLTYLTFVLFEDHECLHELDVSGADYSGSKLMSLIRNDNELCLEVQRCTPYDNLTRAGELKNLRGVFWNHTYQIWPMSFSDTNEMPYVYVDYFNFFGKCDYGGNETYEFDVPGTDGNETIFSEYFKYNTINLGQCERVDLFGVQRFARAYYGCEDAQDMQTFIADQLDDIIITLSVIVGFVGFTICVLCCTGCIQVITMCVIDLTAMYQRKKIAPVIKDKSDNFDKLRDVSLTDDSMKHDHLKGKTLGESLQKLTLFRGFKGKGLLSGFSKKTELRPRRLFKCSTVFGYIFRTLFSIGIIVMIEIRKVFSIWFSVIIFLRSDVDKDNPLYIENTIVYSQYQTVLLTAFIVYICIDVLFIVYWVERFVISPVKVIIIYPCLREWLFYRMLMIITYVFYMYYGILAFIDTNNDYHKQYLVTIGSSFESTQLFFANFTSSGWWSAVSFYLKFFVSLLYLAVDILGALYYDGCSSINYYHRMKSAGLKFPEVAPNLTWLFVNCDKTLHKLITVVTLIDQVDKCKDIEDLDEAREKKVKREIQVLSKSIDYGNFPWYMINKLTGKEIKFLKSVIFLIGNTKLMQERKEEEFLDILLYHSPAKIDWMKSLFCHSCIKYSHVFKSHKDTSTLDRTLKIHKVVNLSKKNSKLKKEISGLFGLHEDHEEQLLMIEQEMLTETRKRIKQYVQETLKRFTSFNIRSVGEKSTEDSDTSEQVVPQQTNQVIGNEMSMIPMNMQQGGGYEHVEADPNEKK